MKWFVLFILLLSILSCESQKTSMNSGPTVTDTELLNQAKEYFSPLKVEKGLNKNMVSLGKKLYLEKKFSKSGTISCNSCHQLDNFGVDNEKTSPGHDGTRGDRNSPTSFNANYNMAQFWDGRAKDLAEQALGPLLNPIEHGMGSEGEVLHVITSKEYRDLFAKAFGKKDAYKDFKNLGIAIAEFEKTLVTPGRFDEFLKGDVKVLSSIEKKGLQKFMAVGCTSCHYGPSLGGQDFQQLGVVHPFETTDLGRFKVTKDEDEKFFFKVPNLRNIEKTHPYFHDGKVATLEEAIRLMGWHQLGEKLTDEDVKSIEAFLKSLNGKLSQSI